MVRGLWVCACPRAVPLERTIIGVLSKVDMLRSGSVTDGVSGVESDNPGLAGGGSGPGGVGVYSPPQLPIDDTRRAESGRRDSEKVDSCFPLLEVVVHQPFSSSRTTTTPAMLSDMFRDILISSKSRVIDSRT